jgi:uncharacterized membrane protein
MADSSASSLMPLTFQALKEHSSPIENPNELHEQSLTLTDRIALQTMNVVGTMGFFYACLAMVTLPLLVPPTMPVLQYISGGKLQLLLLPLIMVGQNLQTRHAEIRAENDYRVNMKAEREIEHMFRHLEHQNAILAALMKKFDLRLEDVLAISEDTHAALEKMAENDPSPDA